MSFKKALIVARREFLTTVLTRGFLFGVLLMPLLTGAVVGMSPLLVVASPVTGSLAVIDKSGSVASGLASRVQHEDGRVPLGRDRLIGPRSPSKSKANLRLEVLPPETDVAAATAELRRVPQPTRMALVVIPEDVLQEDASFEIYAAPALDILLQQSLADQVSDAIIDARVAAHGYAPETIRRLTARPGVTARTVTQSGHEETSEVARLILPLSFMMLLWVAAFTAGQFLLTTLVEEKSLRVMEVLLSAVSPLELMAGKIVGYCGVGLVVLTMYLGLGMSSLFAFGMSHLVDPAVAGLVGVFFIIAFLLIASLMAAVGSVVDDIRSAQSLLTPAMLLLAMPTVLWPPISRNPNSPFATVLSFVPPLGPFVTVLRLASPEPTPPWQVVLSLTVGIASVVGAIWTAAKIFRIGVLMYGKPPTLRTMLRWVRER